MLRNFRPDRLDVGVGVTVLVLIIAIGVTVAGGDRAGVGVSGMSPQITAHTRTAIRISFDEPMDTASVESRFVIDPAIKGKFSWSGQQLTFSPNTALSADQTYTITLRAGATSVQGRPLVADVRWTFRVASPRVVYLAPAVRDQSPKPPNLWIVDPGAPFVATQLTFGAYGLIDFAPSPDGTHIAYAQKNASGSADLFVLTVEGNTVQQITNCPNALCQSPDWSPDGSRIAYERIELNRDLPQADKGAARAWIVNLKDLSTAPLFRESQLLGHTPRWSPDGKQIAVYDQNLHAIAIYDLTTGDRKQIPSLVGENGVFDPAGVWFAYPQLAQTQQGFFTRLGLANLANPQTGVRNVGERDDPVSDGQPAWTPDGKRLAITRRYLDTRTTRGPQVYLIDLQTNAVQPLVVDPNYIHGAIAWNSAGDQLLMQRYSETESEPQTGIWVYEMQTKALRQIATNGYLPQWLP